MSREVKEEGLRDQSTFDFAADVSDVDTRYNVAVVGSTGLVGRTLLRVLYERRFPIGELHLYASPESERSWIDTPLGEYYIERLNPRKVQHHDLVFMAAGSSVARAWGWRFARRGAVVIDKSAYFRDKPYAPLIVPEVNADVLENHQGIVANPNCTTIPLVTALSPLHKSFGLRRFTVVSFQSVSGCGKKGMLALERELEDDNAEATVFPHRIADNVIPWIGSTTGTKRTYKGYSGEEIKMIRESRKILRLPRLSIQATAVRIPIMVGHSLAVHAGFSRSVSVEKAVAALNDAAGITVMDDPSTGEYPMPLVAAGRDDVLVGRIRRDRGRHSLALWITTDNLRKGAATNAVQIAEALRCGNMIKASA